MGLKAVFWPLTVDKTAQKECFSAFLAKNSRIKYCNYHHVKL